MFPLQFTEVPFLGEGNIEDAKNWLNNDEVVGLVDENLGGIIGYINLKHIYRILELLNK